MVDLTKLQERIDTCMPNSTTKYYIEYLKEKRSQGLVNPKKYELPPLDTIGKRMAEFRREQRAKEHASYNRMKDIELG